MKEMQPGSIRPNDRGFVPSLADLTVRSDPSTLDARGNIFMAEPGQGEQPLKQSKIESTGEDRELQESTAKGVSKSELRTPEGIERARKAWEELNAGRIPSVNEKKVQEEAIGMGLSPMAGGAEPLDLLDYSDQTLQNIVAELNAEVNRGGLGNPLSPIFIQEQQRNVRNLLNSGQVDSGQAVRLLGELNSWMAEAQGGQESNRSYIGSRDEQLILTNDEERERVFEEIFVGVDANPGVEFLRALSLEAGGKLDNFFTILNHARVYDAAGVDITDDPSRAAEVTEKQNQYIHEYSGKREIRRILHDANWSVSGGGDIQAFGQAMSTFQSEHIDLIFQDPIVGTALHMFEQAFQQIKADSGGQLPYEEIAWNYKTKSSNLEDKVWSLMREEMRVGVIPNIPEWRLRRAIILARGFGVASLRFPEIAAQARLPEETPMASSTERMSRFGSIYGEAIARYLDPLEHLIEKFAIGEDDRAILYHFLTGKKARFESKEQLQLALKMASNQSRVEKRLIDIINIFRIGGGFSQTSWRQFMSMRHLSPEERRRFGIGVLESRVHGDVDDDIREEVRVDLAGRSEQEMANEVKRRQAGKETRVLQKRIAMWKDVLKANPLRVMWQLEEKVPGQRVKFLSEALGISEDDAKIFLPQVEKDLILIQENTVQALGRGDITYNDPEMLDYGLIGGNNPSAEELLRRERVQKYVEKIRAKAGERDYKLIKSFFEKTPAERSPFPFVIGFEDIPFSDYDFINTGGRGFARRINDYAASVTATNELINLITSIPQTHNIGPLIEGLGKIKHAISQYDQSIAMEVVPYLAEGLIRIYDKDVVARLPLGVGTLVGLLNDSSFAQTVYGREAMTWDEGDKYNFTRHLLQNYLVNKEQLQKLRKRVGATYLNVGVDIARTYGQLALLLLLYEFTKATAQDK